MAYEVVSGLGEYELAGLGADFPLPPGGSPQSGDCKSFSLLQMYLNALGLGPVPTTGVWGMSSAQALKRFCIAVGLPPIGWPTPMSCTRLRLAVESRQKKAVKIPGMKGFGSYEVISGLGDISSAQVGTKMATGSWCGSPNPKVIQQALDELGFPTKADGIWGSGSLASLNAFGATRGLPKATFPTSAHCVAIKQAIAEKEAAAIAAAQAATQQASTQQVPVTNVGPGNETPPPPSDFLPPAGGEGGMSTRTMVLLGVAGVAAVGLLVAVALSGSDKHEETAELKKNHDCDGFSCLECYPELCESSAMIPRVADQALAMALADPAGAKAFLRNAGDKLLGIDGEPDPIIPRWTWAAAAGLGGLALGIFLSQRFPRYMPRLAPLRKNHR